MCEVAESKYDGMAADMWSVGVLLLELACGVGTPARLCPSWVAGRRSAPHGMCAVSAFRRGCDIVCAMHMASAAWLSSPDDLISVVSGIGASERNIAQCLRPVVCKSPHEARSHVACIFPEGV